MHPQRVSISKRDTFDPCRRHQSRDVLSVGPKHTVNAIVDIQSARVCPDAPVLDLAAMMNCVPYETRQISSGDGSLESVSWL